MAKPPVIPRAEDFDEALGQLVNARGRRAAVAAQIATLETGLAECRQQVAAFDKEIAARAAALRAAHKAGDFFDWAAKAPA